MSSIPPGQVPPGQVPPGYVPPPGYPPGYVPPAPGMPPPASGPRGCWRTGLIGCGIAGLVLILCVIAFVLYMRRNPQIMTNWIMTQVDSHMASDVTEQDRKELHDAYDAYVQKLKTRSANPEGLRRMQGVFMNGSNNEISRQQVHDLTDSFRRAAGLPPLKRSENAPAPPATTPAALAATPSP
jgi:hypothetical protein